MHGQEREDLIQALAFVINEQSRENESNTPDFILGEFLVNCLEAMEGAIRERDDWYSIHPYPGGALSGQSWRGKGMFAKEHEESGPFGKSRTLRVFDGEPKHILGPRRGEAMNGPMQEERKPNKVDVVVNAVIDLQKLVADIESAMDKVAGPIPETPRDVKRQAGNPANVTELLNTLPSEIQDVHVRLLTIRDRIINLMV